MFQFMLPDPGEGLTEAEIVEWRVAEGDEVAINDILVEVETAKSLVELPAPVAGQIARLLVRQGETAAVGQAIVEIQLADDKPESADSEPAQPEGSEPQPEPDEIDEESSGAQSVAAQAEVIADVAPTQMLVGSGPQADTSQRSTRPAQVEVRPQARRLARMLGVDIEAVLAASEGMVTAEDVQRHAARAAGRESRRPIKGVRKATAQAVAASTAKHVHATEFQTVEVGQTVELVEKLRARKDMRDEKITLTTLVAYYLARVVRRHPVLIARWDDEAGEIVQPTSINLGMAVATPRGLLVPVIRDADQLTVRELASAIRNQAARGRAGSLQPSDFEGGTITLTNVGVFGVNTGTPIINGDESAIVALGSVDRRPWVMGSGDDERIEPAWVTTLALSIDHRLIDGEEASRFLADLAGVMHEPGMLAMF